MGAKSVYKKSLSLIVAVIMVVSVLNITAFAAAPSVYSTIGENSSTTVSISTAGTSKYFKLVPTKNGTLTYYSTGSYDSYGYILNSSGSTLVSNDDGGSNNNFSMTYYVTEGTTYYLQARMYSSSTTGSFIINTSLAADVQSTNTSTPVSVTAGTNTYTLFNSGRTGNGYNYSSSSNPSPTTLTNGGYDIYATTSGLSTVYLGLPFVIESAVTEQATLTIFAYDVDESSGERDLIRLIDQTANTTITLSGYLSGMDRQWNTTTFKIDPSCFTVGHTYCFQLYDSVSGWVVYIRNVAIEIPCGAGVEPPVITLSDFYGTISSSGQVSTTLELTTSQTVSYNLEYAATHSNGNQYGSATSSLTATPSGVQKSLSFNLTSGAPSGVYTVEVIIKGLDNSVITTYRFTSSITKFSVNYNSNGGSQNLPNDTTAYSDGDTVTVLFNYIPSRSGYSFLGWSRNRNSVLPEFVLNGSKTFVINQNTTLYAIWNEEHLTHNMTHYPPVDATCTGDGNIEYYVCTVCDKWFSDSAGTEEIIDHNSIIIPATGHTASDWIIDAPATCTYSGSKHIECLNCHRVLQTALISAIGHNYVHKLTVDATCTEDGYVLFECDRDGCYATRKNVISALGHTFGGDNICDRCGYEIPIAHTHNYVATIVNPTCITAGYTLYVCNCGDEYKSDFVEPAGHRWDNGDVTIENTCTADGLKTYICAVCGDTYTEIIPAGHNWEEVVVTEATCTENGLMRRICSRCGETEDVIIPAGHKWDEGTILVSPTCTQAGLKECTCTVCGITDTIEISALGHYYVNGICQRCGHMFIDDVSADPNHPVYGMYFEVDDIQSAYGPDLINEYGVLLDFNPDAKLDKVAVYLTQDGTMWRRCIACTGENIKYATYVPYLSYGTDIKYTGLNSWQINTFSLSEGSDHIWRYSDYATIGVNLADKNGRLLLSLYNIGQAGAKTRLFDDLEEMKRWLKEDSTNVSIKAAKNYVSEEDLVSFEVSVSNGNDISSITIDPRFNHDVFEFAYGEWTINGAYYQALDYVTKSATSSFNNIDINAAVYRFTLKAKGALGPSDVGCSVKINTSESEMMYSSITTVNVTEHNVIGENDPYIQVDSKKACPGNTVDVDIRLFNNPGITSAKLKVSYQAGLTLNKVAFGNIGGYTIHSDVGQNFVILNWFNGLEDLAAQDIVYATLTFSVADDSEFGVKGISVDYDPDDIFNIDYENVDFAIINGGVEVVDHILGDINDNGKVDNKDLVALFQYLSNWGIAVNENALDINGDGTINNKDLTRLFQYLSGWNVEIF